MTVRPSLRVQKYRPECGAKWVQEGEGGDEQDRYRGVDKRERGVVTGAVTRSELIRKHLSPEPGKFENKWPID